MRLILSERLRAEIIARAQAEWPEEVCGLLAGSHGVAAVLHPGRNVSPTPRVAYELDLETLLKVTTFEDDGLKLVAIYHSHPQGPESPSPTDIERAAYPDAAYLICSLAARERPVLRAFTIIQGRLT